MTVSGSVKPDIENPAPAGVTCVTTKLAVPVLEIVMFFDEEVPVVTLPKANVVGLKPIFATDATPVPAKFTVAGGLREFETRVIVPFTVPAVVGANLICPTEDCDAAILKGNENPVTENPAPVMLIAVTESGEPPVFWIVRFWVAEALSVTFAKFTLTGVTVACGCCGEPIPVRVTSGIAVGASLVTATDPFKVPPDCGAKWIVTCTFWPAGIETGRTMAGSEKAVPVTWICETLTAAPPGLDRVSGRSFVEPTFTLPKSMLVGDAESAPGLEIGPAFVAPAPALPQPAMINASIRTKPISSAWCKLNVFDRTSEASCPLHALAE